MARLINPNLRHLVKCFQSEMAGAVLEGSSRSAKTWSSVDFIIWYCSKVSTDSTINIIKETYKSFKTTLYDDFNRRLPMYGLSSPFQDRQEVSSFKLFGNKINLLGADSDTVYHGASSDLLYFNEILDISQKVFDQSEMRCRKFFWCDYNPKAADHWVYNAVCSRPDVGFLKTTFLDNPFLSQNEKRKILSYEPTHPEDRHLPREQRRPHPTNITNGTADDFMWDVYGLGLRSAPEGLIFKDVTYIDEFPKNIEKIYYGSDIGQSQSPSVFVKAGIEGKNLYVECLSYEPTPSTDDYVKLAGTCLSKKDATWCDSAEPGYIAAGQRAGYKFFGVGKFPGSIMYGIGLIKNFKLHIVKNKHYHAVLREQTNYKHREVNGIRLEEPIDDFNHFWDALRYAIMSNVR